MNQGPQRIEASESMSGRLIERSHLSAAGRAVWVHPMCGRWWPKAQRLCSATSSDEEGKAVAAELA